MHAIQSAGTPPLGEGTDGAGSTSRDPYRVQHWELLAWTTRPPERYLTQEKQDYTNEEHRLYRIDKKTTIKIALKELRVIIF